MELVGALLNFSAQERLEKLASMLAKIVASRATPRPSALAGKRRPGVLTEVTEKVLAEAPMRMYEIYSAAEALIGQPVPRSSVKNSLARLCKGEHPRFVRLARGRYRLAT